MMSIVTRLVGVLLCLFGLLLAVYFFFSYYWLEQAATPSLGLMNQRLCGTIFGGALMVSGLLLCLIGVVEQKLDQLARR